jgi:hypothetical protein
MTASQRPPRRRPDVAFQPLADGSGVLVDGRSGNAYALNETAAGVWELCDGLNTCDDIAAHFLERYEATLDEARSGVVSLIAYLTKLDVLEPSEAGPALSDLPYRSCYELMGFRVEVASSSEELSAGLDRLNAKFRAPGATGVDAIYTATEHPSGGWRLTFQGSELRRRCDSLLATLGYLEWHICDQAIERRHDLLHVHGAALAGSDASVLMPGAGRIGKTTFALALALRGLRMLSDDVVFVQPDNWRPEPFPRSLIIRDGTLARLKPLGFGCRPEDLVGKHLCSTALGSWAGAAGPPLRFILFPRLEPEAPLSLEPISGAAAVVELMRCSKNLRRFPRFGLDHVPRLLEQAECFVLHRNDDLAAAADLVYRLVTRGSVPQKRPGRRLEAPRSRTVGLRLTG